MDDVTSGLSRTVRPYVSLVCYSLVLLSLVTCRVEASALVIEETLILVGEEASVEALTCWTCPDKPNNDECNDWAPDLECPYNHTVCKTVHEIHIESGISVRVNKFCARETDCTVDMIGCRPGNVVGVQECTSCCGVNYCNELAPSNQSSAILLSSFPNAGASPWTGYHVRASVVLSCAVTWFARASSSATT